MRTTIWQKRSPLIGMVIASVALLSLAHAATHSTSSSHVRRLSQSSSVVDVYDANTASGSSSFLNVVCGIIAGVAVLYGALFFVDRETFTQITGQAGLVPCTDKCNCKCKKRLIDQDDEDITEFERDMAARAIATGRDDDEASSPYLTLETIDYLREKHDQAVDKPKRMLLSLYQKCKPKKVIDESDKYRTPDEDDIHGGIAACPPNAAVSNMFETVTNVFQEMRLKLCWTPAKQYDTQDKYKLSDEVAGGANDDDDATVEIIDVQRQASSYESDPRAPW